MLGGCVVVRCSLLVVVFLFVVNRWLCVVRCLLFVDRWLLGFGCCVLFVVV